MPRINFIPPPIDFQDRGTALVNPIMANAMQLAETFTTEIPRIRMQQEAVGEDKRRYESSVARDESRYGTKLKMEQDDRAVAGRERQLAPFKLKAQQGLLTPEDEAAVAQIDSQWGGTLRDVSGKVKIGDEDKDFDSRFGNIFPKVTGDPLAARGGRSTVRDDLAREKAANAPYALREKERSDARQRLAGERFDHDSDPTTPSILMSPADVNKRVDELFPAMPRVDPNDPGTTGESPLGEYGPATAGGPMTMGGVEGGPAISDVERIQLEAMIAHSAAVRKLGQPAIDRIKQLIGQGATVSEAQRQVDAEAAALEIPNPPGYGAAPGAEAPAAFNFNALPDPATLPGAGAPSQILPPEMLKMDAPGRAPALPISQNQQGRQVVSMGMQPEPMISNEPWRANVSPEKAMRIDMSQPQKYAGDDRNFGMSDIQMPDDQGGGSPYVKEFYAVKQAGTQVVSALAKLPAGAVDQRQLSLYQKAQGEAEAALNDALTAGTPGAYQRYQQAISDAHLILTEQLIPLYRRIPHLPTADELRPGGPSTDPARSAFPG
jgi:hypothetical protein